MRQNIILLFFSGFVSMPLLEAVSIIYEKKNRFYENKMNRVCEGSAKSLSISTDYY